MVLGQKYYLKPTTVPAEWNSQMILSCTVLSIVTTGSNKHIHVPQIKLQLEIL